MSTTGAILQLMLTPGLGNKTLAELLLRLADEQREPEDFIASPLADLVHAYKLRLGVASAVANSRDQATALAEELDEHDIQLVPIGSRDYPHRLIEVLGRDAPPALFARGDLAILGKSAVAIAGSRHASEASLRAATMAASTLAAADLNVVSGYANGIDVTAHTAALSAGGATTLVLAEGILHYRVKREIADQLTAANHLILSEFPPTLRWIARNAMQRNRTIIGLSAGLLIVESGEDGGTFAAGEEALRRHVPLFVLQYPDSHRTPTGNETLIRRGGYPVQVDDAGHMDFRTVLECALSASNQPNPTGLWDTLL